MVTSTDVNLPRAHPAVYPKRCVRCGGDHQGHNIRLWTHTIGWWTVVFWMFGQGFTTRPPACRKCALPIRIHRIGGTVLGLMVAVLFMIFVWPQLDDFVARSLRKWVALGLVMVCFSPYLLWESIFPPAIDITAFKDSVDYEFRDEDFAHEFAELNRHAKWVEIS